MQRRGFLGSLIALPLALVWPAPKPQVVAPSHARNGLFLDDVRERYVIPAAEQLGREYNYWLSQQVELIALAPKAPWEGQ